VQQGFEVRTAGSGEDALHLLEREAFDVIVTDLVMPGLSGAELVERVKARAPEQEVIVVTSVGDVRTAVDAMRMGASDYLLKPLDPTLLERSPEGILQRKRLRQEHASLMAENLEYLGHLSLYERTLALFSTLAIEPLADRIVEALCLETRAQGGVAWVARAEDAGRLRLATARGLVRVEREPEEIALDALPAGLEALSRPEATPLWSRWVAHPRWSCCSVTRAACSTRALFDHRLPFEIATARSPSARACRSRPQCAALPRSSAAVPRPGRGPTPTPFSADVVGRILKAVASTFVR
jgi:FixJ family two-component response regulator